MRGLIDRITNRDKVEELEAALKEFEEKAETLTGTIRVLKMRFDTIFPATKMEREVDEPPVKSGG